MEGGRRAGTMSQPGARPRQASSKLPSGTRAQGSVLSGRGESSGHNGATALGRHMRGIPRGDRWRQKEEGWDGGPEGPEHREDGRGEWIKEGGKGQHGMQGRRRQQLSAGVGAGFEVAWARSLVAVGSWHQVLVDAW